MRSQRAASVRRFGARVLALSPAFVQRKALAGTLKAGLAGGSTTDTLDPATYTDTYMQAVAFATHSNLTEVSPRALD